MNRATVLIIDDEKHLITSYEEVLFSAGISDVAGCSDSRKAMKSLEETQAKVVLLDLMMPHQSGEQILTDISANFPQVHVIVTTGDDRTDIAVACMKKGAFDFMCKPVTPERLTTTVINALKFSSIESENLSLKKSLLQENLKTPQAFQEIITHSDRIQSLFRYIEAVSQSPYPILITGETGVGKELFARSVYRTGDYVGDFVAINVAGLDDNVFSDSLFGHKRGAYTGADTTREGLIEQAQGGVLFLDEIGDISPASQLKLLRLLQEKEYYRLGEDRPRSTNARLVLATNHNLEKQVEQGKFRQDLFYRLYTHKIEIPPLRERVSDLPLLTEHFVTTAATEIKRGTPHIPNELFNLLENYPFPGNVRELEALIFNAMSLSTDVLNVESIRERIQHSQTTTELKPTHSAPITFGKTLPHLNDAKEALIHEAIKRTDGNKTLAAKMLGTTRQTLNKYV